MEQYNIFGGIDKLVFNKETDNFEIMQKHTKIYLDYYNLDQSDFIGCEICQKKATEIHHLIIKGMGGSKTKDYIENLMAICRTCHQKCHASIEFNTKAKKIHKLNL